MTDSVTVRAPAKINLHLGVGPVRADGYHPLTTVYQAIGLYDDVTAHASADWSVEVTAVGSVDVSGVPLDESNIALRAAVQLMERHAVPGACRLEIAKGIPVAGGLAGGSADAAATLVAVDRLFDLRASDEELVEIAAGLGSDVPFALVGGTAAGSGRGELVARVPDAGSWWWVVLPSAEGLSTPAVYHAFDDGFPGSTARPEALLTALAAGDADGLGSALENDLEGPALLLRPDLRPVHDAIRDSSALGELLSGSGPTFLALARDARHARALAAELRGAGHRDALVAPAPVAGAHVVEY